MYLIQTKDKCEILHIFFRHRLSVRMDTLITEYPYHNLKKYKKEKILKIMDVLEKELNRYY